MQLIQRFVFFGLIFFAHSVYASLYLYSGAPIPVYEQANSSSKVIYNLKPGDTFEVIRWNNFQSRIRLANGQEAFIDRSLLQNLIRQVAPQVLDAETENRENLPKPLRLTMTDDDTLLIRKQAYAVTSQTHNAEFSTGASSGDTLPDGVSEDLPDQDVGEFDNNSSTLIPRRESFAAMSLDRYAFVSNFGLTTWENAIKRRKLADFLGKGYRRGNRSKGKCAEAVKDSLVAAGVCTSRPEGDALATHTSGSIINSCPRLKVGQTAKSGESLTEQDILNAPGGSVTVYSGYSGRRKHNYGHIEIKVPMTKELKDKMGKDALDIELGEYMYCSDFCRATPTPKKDSNAIVAIYNLK